MATQFEVRFQVFQRQQGSGAGSGRAPGAAVTSMVSQVVNAPSMHDARQLVKAQYSGQHVEISSTRQVGW